MPPLDRKRMKNLIVVAILLFSFTTSPAQSQRIGNYQFKKSKGNHTARIVIRNESFNPSKHKIGYDERSGKNLVDGRVAYGAESVPRTQISSIEFYVDGRKISVPSRLFADCYNPNLEHRYVNIRWSRDARSVLITMLGADGAGAYYVVWILKRNGKHSRYFKDAF